MYRGREMLLQRVRNRLDQEHGKSAGTSESGRNGRDGALKRSKVKKSDILPVSHWFRHTEQAAKARYSQAREEEFQSFLREKMKEHALQRDQELQRKTQDEQKGTVDLHQICQLKGFSSADVNKMPAASHPSISPLRKKHKKMIPKRNQQYSSSVILGEDPELDQMIENIVLKFTHECTDSSNAGGVEFDGSAISVLREAAKDTLNTMTNQGHNVVDDCQIVTKKTNDAAFDDEASFARYNSTADGKTNMQIHNLKDDEEVTDNRISHMIKELIGEIEQDSDCHFDGGALEALKEATKDIVSKDDGFEF
ncbi:hypothetical protein ACHAW5_008523 [Stephanodiscus triporus]|uniref:Uncharacterized protein n=1 Tax=Stephanodiscus triporus TaxID=2934178 RepID=A0ABD3NGQ4_9STRA